MKRDMGLIREIMQDIEKIPASDEWDFKDFNRDPNWMMLVPFTLLMVMIIALGLWSAPLVTFLRNVAAGLTF